MSWDNEKVRAMAQAQLDKREGEAIVNRAKKVIAELDEPLRNMFAEEGVGNPKVEVAGTDVDDAAENIIADQLSIYSSVLTEGIVAEAIVAALREADLLKPNVPKKTVSLYIGSRLWAKCVQTGRNERGEPETSEDDWIRACRALEAKGYAAYVGERFNITSLSSAVKEDFDNGIIPEGSDYFDGTIEVNERFQISARVKNG